MKHLFYVQDNDRPMHVIADTFNDAQRLWERRVRQENDMAADEPVDPPAGIQCLCDEDDLIWPGCPEGGG